MAGSMPREPETGKRSEVARTKDSVNELGGGHAMTSLPPAVYDGRFVGMGQDPPDGIGHFYCIDPRQGGDISRCL